MPRVVFIITFEDDLGFGRHQTVPRKEGEPFLGKIGSLIFTDFMVEIQSELFCGGLTREKFDARKINNQSERCCL